jgi:PGF-pre-PGF domain-containing protein
LTADSTVTIYLREGTYYPGSVRIGDYTGANIGFSSDIHLRNYQGEHVVIDCKNNPYCFVIGTNTTIEGLEITNFEQYSIKVMHNIYNNFSIHIRNNTIHTCGPNAYSCSGIRIDGGDNHVISGNRIFNVTSMQKAYETGIDLQGNNALIENNIVHDNVNHGIHVRGNNNTIVGNKVFNHYQSYDPSGVMVNGMNNTIHNNTLYDNQQNLLLSSCRGCTVSHNLIYSSNNQIGKGIEIRDSPFTKLQSNTVAHVPGYGVEISSWSHDFEIKNNIIYGSAGAAMYIESKSTPTIKFISDYNLFHSFSGNPIYFNGREYGSNSPFTINHYQNQTHQDGSSLFQADPQFNFTYLDFRPKNSSPVCNMSETGNYIGALPCIVSNVIIPPVTPTPQPVPSCSPDWVCTTWSQCVNGTQARTCFDWNTCNTSLNKPVENQSCTVPSVTPPSIQDPSVVVPPTTQPDDTGITAPDHDGSQPPDTTFERPTIIQNYTRENIEIMPEQPATVQIQKPRIGLNLIRINVRKQVSDVSIRVARISSKPAEIIQNATGEVYQYLNITHENITDQDIDLITIFFDVNKSWIAERNANKSDVYLSRFVINQWTRLPTRIINETEESIKYKALSPGLSIFSIMSGSILSATNRTCVPYDIRCKGKEFQKCDSSGDIWVTQRTCEQACSESVGCMDSPEAAGKTDPWTLITIMIVIILVLAIVAFYFQSKREGLTKEIREIQTSR